MRITSTKFSDCDILDLRRLGIEDYSTVQNLHIEPKICQETEVYQSQSAGSTDADYHLYTGKLRRLRDTNIILLLEGKLRKLLSLLITFL